MARSARVLEIEIEPAGARAIAERARGTPRVANRLLKRVRDYAEVRGGGVIDAASRRRGAGPARGRPRGPGPAGPRDPRRHLPPVRRRPGRALHARRGRPGGVRHDRGRLRALPAPARVPPAHPARALRHPARVPPPRACARPRARRSCSADAGNDWPRGLGFPCGCSPRGRNPRRPPCSAVRLTAPARPASRRYWGVLATRVTSTRLIGRTAELAELEAAFAAAADGHPSIAFVAGESGVGKSRLVSELSARAKARGARTLCGECVELGEGELPYAPLVAALRPLVARRRPRARRRSATPPAPSWPRCCPSSAPADAAPRGADDGRRHRPAAAVRGAAGAAGAPRPRAPGPAAARGHPLGRQLHALVPGLRRPRHEHRARARRLHLPLRRAAPPPPAAPAAGRARARPERPPDRARPPQPRRARRAARRHPRRPARAPTLVERLYGRSEGNPLFAEELLAAGGDGRGALPPTLRDALMVRTERLPEAAQEVLRVLAVAQRADHALLADAAGLAPPSCAPRCARPPPSHLIVAGADGMYRFRHALLREVVHDDLLPGEHAELHLALARALERRARRRRRGRLDHRRDGAPLPLGGRPAGGAEGERAGRAPPPRACTPTARPPACSSARWRSGTACPTPRRSRAPRTPTCSCAPPPRTAPTSTTTGARSCCARRSPSSSGDGDPTRTRWPRCSASSPSAQWSLGRGEESRATLRRALALLPDGDRSAERAQLLSRRVAFLMLQGRYGEVRDGARGGAGGRPRRRRRRHLRADPQPARRRAVRARRPGGRRGRLRRGDRGRARHRPGDRRGVRGRQPRRRAAPRRPQPRGPGRRDRRRGRPPAGLARRALAGDAAGGDRVRPRRVGRRRGAPPAPWPPHRYDAGLLQPHARRAAARPRRHARRAAAARGDRAHPRALARAAVPGGQRRAARRARAPRGRPRRRPRGRRGGDRPDRVLQRGRRAARRGRLRRRARRGRRRRARPRPRRRGGRARRPAARRDDATRACRPPPRTSTCRSRPPTPPAPPPTSPAPPASPTRRSTPPRPRRGRRSSARTPPPSRRFAQAEAHLRAGDRDATVAAARAAAAARPRARRAAGSRARSRASPPAPACASTTRRPPPARTATAEEEAAFGLTPRELQVLALLAGGATNREIGAQLFMAEKTASVHVSRILSKLDVRTPHRGGRRRPPARPRGRALNGS